MSGTFLLSVLTLFAASSVVLSGLVLLVLRLFGKRIRHAVCCLILTACALRILIPTGFFFPALIPFSLSRETTVTAVEGETHRTATEGEVEATVPTDADTTVLLEAEQAEQKRNDVAGSERETADPIATAPTGSMGETKKTDLFGILPYLVSAVWSGGALIAFCLLFFPQYSASRKIRRDAMPAQGETLRIYEAVCRDLSGVSRPRLLIAQASVVPHLCGLFRPAIVIGKTDLSPEALAMVFRHELNHYRRRDLWIRRILFVDVCCFWWNPLVWLFARRGQAETELACDEAVLNGLDADGRCTYGQTIFSVMRENLRTPIGLSAGFSGQSDRVKRFRELLDPQPRRSGIALATLLCLILFASSAVVGCAHSSSGGTVLKIDSNELDAKHVKNLADNLEAPERSGYRFTGWEVTSGRGKDGSVSVSFEPRYSPIVYSVRFETNGGTLPAGTENRYTVEQTLPVPTRGEEIFAGWYCDAGLTSPAKTVPTENNCTLYAAWRGESTAGDFTVSERGGGLTVTGYRGNGTDVTVPAYINGKPVCEIGVNAFSFCTSLQSLTLPGSVCRIGAGAFRYCYRLETIRLGSVPSALVDRSAFEACYALKQIDFPGTGEQWRTVFGGEMDTLYHASN